MIGSQISDDDHDYSDESWIPNGICSFRDKEMILWCFDLIWHGSGRMIRIRKVVWYVVSTTSTSKYQRAKIDACNIKDFKGKEAFQGQSGLRKSSITSSVSDYLLPLLPFHWLAYLWPKRNSLGSPWPENSFGRGSIFWEWMCLS